MFSSISSIASAGVIGLATALLPAVSAATPSTPVDPSPRFSSSSFAEYPSAKGSAKTKCERAVRAARPAWVAPAGWTFRCVTTKDFDYSYDAYSRRMEISASYPTKTSKIASVAWSSIPKIYRNDSRRDCERIVKANVNYLKKSSGFKGVCSRTPPRGYEDAVGLADYGTKKISLFYQAQTLRDLQETYFHEAGHAMTLHWNDAELRNWKKLTNRPWDTGTYELQASEIWAESYASYVLKQKLTNTGIRVLPSSVVKKQLDFVKTH